MSEVITTIERFFQSFIKESSPYNFYLLMADYVKVVNETPEIEPILQILEKQRLAEYEKLKKLDEQCLKELNEPVKVVLAQMSQYRRLEGINEAMQQLKDYLDGKFIPAEPRPIAIELFLYNIVTASGKRYSNGVEFFNKFKTPNRQPQNTYGNYTFSKSIEVYKAQKENIEHSNEYWNAWYHLRLVNKVINSNDKEANAIFTSGKLEPSKLDENVKYLVLWKDWKKIVKEHKSFDPENFADPTHFLREKFSLLAKRFHLYLVNELTRVSEKSEKTMQKHELRFEPNESNLYFQGKEILIAKSKNTDPHYLLQTIFTEPAKVWNYDEVAADWQTTFDQTKWKKYYNAANKVNQKVATKTGVEDFLETSKMTVNINKKYIPD